jgi:Secretion system C-terminal sorting domain
MFTLNHTKKPSMKKLFTSSKAYQLSLRILSPKRSKSLILLLFLAFPFVSPAQIIWNTGSQVFSFTGAGQQDCMTAQTCLTRTTVLFNSVCQTVSGNQGCGYTGPCNTEWAYGDIAIWNSLTYTRLFAVNGSCAQPPTWVGNPLVCHLIAEDIYLQLTFNSWNSGTNGNFSYTRSALSTLPVILSQFKGTRTGKSNLLSWTSSTEINCSHYNLQRSVNGTDFKTLGKIFTKSPDGNSSVELNYRYSDDYPVPGNNNYRLEQVDKDGRKQYSQVVNLFLSHNGSAFSIIQNPTTNWVNLYISAENASKASVKLVDMNGRILQNILTTIEKGNNTLRVNLDNLPSGLFVIQVYENAVLSFSGKIIKSL